MANVGYKACQTAYLPYQLGLRVSLGTLFQLHARGFNRLTVHTVPRRGLLEFIRGTTRIRRLLAFLVEWPACRGDICSLHVLFGEVPRGAAEERYRMGLSL